MMIVYSHSNTSSVLYLYKSNDVRAPRIVSGL